MSAASKLTETTQPLLSAANTQQSTAYQSTQPPPNRSGNDQPPLATDTTCVKFWRWIDNPDPNLRSIVRIVLPLIALLCTILLYSTGISTFGVVGISLVICHTLLGMLSSTARNQQHANGSRYYLFAMLLNGVVLITAGLLLTNIFFFTLLVFTRGVAYYSHRRHLRGHYFIN